MLNPASIFSRLYWAIAFGFIAGSALNALSLALFPSFFSHVYELALFPGAIAIMAILFSVLRQALRPRPSPEVGKGLSKRFATTLVLALVIPVVLYAARSSSRNWSVSPRVMIFCIDSATWSVADPLIDAGQLPTLAGIREQGVSGILRSTDPSFTPIVWTTIATGVSPEVHGITSFYATQKNLRSKRIWDILEEHGQSTGVFRWPVTWPPRRTSGFIIPDILARDAASYPAQYAFINQMRADYKTRKSVGGLGRNAAIMWRILRSGLRLDTSLLCAKDLIPAVASGDNRRKYIALRRVELRLNTDIFRHLLRTENPEFATFYDNGVDMLGHKYWKYFEPELFPDVTQDESRLYGSAIPDFYKLVDRSLARILDHIDPSTTVVVLSDHGQKANEEATNAAFFPRTDQLLAAMNISESYYGIKLGARTYLESVETDPSLRRAALEKVAAQLSEISVDGMKLFRVKVLEDDRVLVNVNGGLKSIEHSVKIGDNIFQLKKLITVREATSGTHDQNGIYAMRGSAIAAGRQGPTLQLTDIAPTLLYLVDVPLSRELQGTIAWDTIDDAYKEGNTVSWVDSYGDYSIDADRLDVNAETMEKLRSLGYVQ